MLQNKFIRSILLALCYMCLTVFLVEKTAVPLLHQHHEMHSKVQGDSLQSASNCYACDLAKASLDAQQTLAFFFSFVLTCLGVLQLFFLVQQTSIAVIFSSLRAPPVDLV